MHYKSIEDFIYTERNEFFNLKIENGEYYSSLNESYYSNKFPDDTFSYDISNNKVVANITEFGDIRHISFYHSCYYCDDIPGVWACKDFTQHDNFYFEIKINGKLNNLSEGNSKVESDLLDNFFPRVSHIDEKYRATIISVAPISKDGRRLSILIYGMYLENTSNEELECEVYLPKKYKKKYSDVRYLSLDLGTYDDYDVKKSYTLKSGESVWIPVILYAPGSYEEVVILKKYGTLYWINQTYEYYRSLVGELKMNDDKLSALIYERSVLSALGAIAMNSKGEIVGSNWGTYPVLKRTWNKDMYYSLLPIGILDPEIYKKSMLWFLEYGIRPKGSKYEGGIQHSLTNSLSSVMMAGLYFEATDDKAFFIKNQEVYLKLKEILSSAIDLKDDDKVNLIPSTWISDAFSLGKYHTGSNIFLWKCLKSFSKLSKEVFNDYDISKFYDEYADKLKADIEGYMTYDGIFGKQYLEGIGSLKPNKKLTYPLKNYQNVFFDQGIDFLDDVHDGKDVNLLMHDGEESDTTLIPFYGYKSYDDIIFRNYLRFTASSHNPTYSTLSRGIKWGNQSEATFPGYTTLFLNTVNKESMVGQDGYMTELKRLIDIDGSWWWWPYKVGSKTSNVERLNSCGKCGWAAGVFSTIFITQILGIVYNAPKKTLKYRPFSPSSNFEWKNARFGNSRFDLSFMKKHEDSIVYIKNKNKYEINVELELIGKGDPYNMLTNTKIEYKSGKFLSNKTRICTFKLMPNEKIEIELK